MTIANRARSVLVIVPTVFVLMFDPAWSQHTDRATREILELQDSRSLGNGKLVTYLSNHDAKLRFRALVALANIQDTSTLSAVTPLLQDKVARVRQGAAFAIGQIGAAPVESLLVVRLNDEKNAGAAARILEALGKSGDRRAMRRILTYKAPTGWHAVTGEQALTLGRFAIRGVKSPAAARWCFDQLSTRDARIRWKALYALWRLCPSGTVDSLIQRSEQLLRGLMLDKSSDVRLQLATLLGKTSSPLGKAILRDFAKREFPAGSWRVQVQLVRSLATWANRDPALLEDLAKTLHRWNDDVRIAAFHAVSDLPPKVLRPSPASDLLRREIRNIADLKTVPEMTRAEAVVAYAKVAPADFRYAAWLNRKDLSDLFKSKILEAMSLIPNPEYLATMMGELNSESIRLSMAAWEFVPRMLQPASLNTVQDSGGSVDQVPDQLYRQAKVALLRDDMAITTLVAIALRDSAVNVLLQANGRADDIVEDLMLAYTQLASPSDVEAMQAVLRTLGAIGDSRCVPVLERALTDQDRTVVVEAANALRSITGEDYSDRIPAEAHPEVHHDWAAFDRIKDHARATIQTSKGTIRMRLLKEDAPFTVLSFVTLARKKFYDGLTFHRVVPNFVIQGGDPRGDGWGGPGYAIRTEVSLVNYERGSVGMASAGKDTEGCQFFITHTPTPHLDGRYTIFAEVERGKSVVDAIQVGDRILSIKILN